MLIKSRCIFSNHKNKGTEAPNDANTVVRSNPDPATAGVAVGACARPSCKASNIRHRPFVADG